MSGGEKKAPGDGKRTCRLDSCRKRFKPKRSWQDFCSTGCRRAYWKENAENFAALVEANRKIVSAFRRFADSLESALGELRGVIREAVKEDESKGS